MADYWKSNPRKFCDFCKCWFADNKSSKQFHESGKRHKENVEKKIGELRKKGQKQYETQQQMSGFLKQMEEDAMKAFKQDVESNPELLPEYRVAVVENRVKKQQEDPSALPGSRYQPGQSGSGSGTQETTPSSSSTSATTPSNPAQEEWVEAVSQEGHTYYWNTKSGATQWEKPANFTPLKSSSSSKDNSSSNKKVDEKSDSSEESAEEEEEKAPRGTKRTSDAYGGWTSISAEPEEEPDLQLPEANPLYMSSYVPQVVQYEPREKLNIQEKKVGSIQAGPREASGSVSFKKRKGGQRQIRSRDATS